MTQRIPVFALSVAVLAGATLGGPGPLLAAGDRPLLTQAHGADQSADHRHSEAGRFSVVVPGGLEATATSSSLQGTVLQWTIAQARQGESYYGVAYTDLPLEVLAQGQATLIESLQAQPLVEGVDWQAISNRGQPITLGDLEGMEYLHLAAGRVTAVRFYLANRRLYAVMASSPDLWTVHHFLDSFAIDPLWQPFVSEPGRFSVNLPMAPVATPQQLTYQGQPLNWWQFVGYNLHAPSDRYGLAYADLPASVATDNADALLTALADRVLTELSVPELTDTGTTITLAGHPGREYLLTHSSGQSYLLRLYLVDRRVYGLLARSKSLDHLYSFLNSFQVQ